MKRRELERLIESYGWYRVPGGKGSHAKYRHPEHLDPLILSGHGSKDVPIGTIRAILKKLTRGSS